MKTSIIPHLFAMLAGFAMMKTAAAVDFDRFEGVYRGSGHLAGDPDRIDHKVHINADAVIRIRPSGKIRCETSVMIRNDGPTRRAIFEFDVDEVEGTVTVSPPFPLWMKEGRKLRAPFAIHRRKVGLVLDARFERPPESSMQVARLSIVRDGRDLYFDYMVEFDHGRLYDLSFTCQRDPD